VSVVKVSGKSECFYYWPHLASCQGEAIVAGKKALVERVGGSPIVLVIFVVLVIDSLK
jgi:hypothetical protein